MAKNVYKKRKFKIGSAPLFVVTGFSILAFMISGFAITYFTDYRFNPTWDSPAFASIFTGEKEIVYAAAIDGTDGMDDLLMIPDSVLAENGQDSTVDNSAEILKDSDQMAEGTDNSGKNSDDVTQEAEATEESDEYVMTSAEEEILKQMYMNDYGRFPYSVYSGTATQFVDWNDNPTRSYYYTNMSVRPVSNAYPYKKVTPDYYKDSLFIGDSRMKGFSDYCGWEEGTFVYKVGLNVFNMMSSTVQSRNGKTKVMDELTAREYENVYLCVGINELGGATMEIFNEKYSEILNIIRENQPDARIIIMSIMYETPSYSESQSIYNNDNINAKNVVISRMANGKDIFYLDVNPSVSDDSGMALTESYSFDGIHMAAKYYELWADYMLSHAY